MDLAQVLLTSSLQKLPILNGSIDIVSARTIYKDILHDTPEKSGAHPFPNIIDRGKYHMGRWLREIHRVLAVGGRLEYIFFDKALYNLQALTAEMEPFLYEECPGCRPSDFGSLPCYSVTGTEFLELLAVEGFESVKTTVLMFPVLTLSSLFTHEGCKREGQPAAAEDRGWWDDSKRVEEGGITVDTIQVLEQIRRECAASGTAWKCTVGWAEKSSMIRYAKVDASVLS